MSETKPQEIAVKKIVLQIGRKEIELSPEEAETLRVALNDLLAKQNVQSITQIISYPAYQWPTYPSYPYRWYTTKTGSNSWNLTCNISGAGYSGGDQGLAGAVLR